MLLLPAILSTLLLLSMEVRAATCFASAGNSSTTLAISGSYAVGDDMNIGDFIYRAKITTISLLGLSCTSNYSNIAIMNKIDDSFTGNPKKMPLPTMGTTGYVYDTNLSGVGVVYWVDWGGLNSFSQTQSVANNSLSTANYKGFDVWIGLVKTGPISPGRVDGSLLPTPVAYAAATPGFTNLPLNLWKAVITGGITFTSSSCNVSASDRPVNMGNYDLQKLLSAGTSDWKDASITLTGCPAFSGHLNWNNWDYTTSQNTTITSSTKQANLLTVSLTPLNGSSTTSDGTDVLKLTSESGKGNAATGVGIELRYNTTINDSSTASLTPWKNGIPWTLNLPISATATPTIKIPLFARYKKTASIINPGQANSKVTFNIQYK